jgi:hypothetical protein
LRGRADNRRFFTSALATLGASFALLFGAVGCGGGGERQDAAAVQGDLTIKIVDAELAPVQQLGQDTTMGLAIENAGGEEIPDLTVTVKVLGEQGENARDAFAYRDPQRNLNRHDRPIWILAPGYPTLRSEPTLGSAGTPSSRTFVFGPLAAGDTAEAIWKLTPVKAGRFRLSYEVSADLYGTGNIEEQGGGAPGGVLTAHVRPQPQHLRVNDRGRVVEVEAGSP